MGAEKSGKGASILLVDDDKLVAELTMLELQDLGYNVVMTNDCASAVAINESNDYDFNLIITDVTLPGMSGPELFEKLKKIRPSLRVLFISGSADHSVCRNYGHDTDLTFLEKPFKPEALAEKIRRLLGE